MLSQIVHPKAEPVVQVGQAVRNRELCQDHYRLTVQVPRFAPATPGQFVHLCPNPATYGGYTFADEPGSISHESWWSDLQNPMLRRAFSIAKLIPNKGGVELDVIYRVVGTATRWLKALHPDDSISVMGPLGRPFPITGKSTAWLIAGGVGLPPLLWLAEELHRHGKKVVAFCGAQTRRLIALDLDPSVPPMPTAESATSCSREFAEVGTPVVISTDDGSLGFDGHVGAALTAFAEANPPPSDDLVVYTCGPERMMHFVSDFCSKRDIECYVCVERNMACGTGMCQSCIVPVHDASDAAGWRYRLCCTEGPVFDAREVIWDA